MRVFMATKVTFMGGEFLRNAGVLLVVASFCLIAGCAAVATPDATRTPPALWNTPSPGSVALPSPSPSVIQPTAIPVRNTPPPPPVATPTYRATAVPAPINPAPAAVWSVPGATGYVALYCNVYWGTEFLPAMLDALAQRNVKITFFVGGSWVAKNPDMLRRIVAEGHEIGSHGYSHLEHSQLNYQVNITEITKAHNIIRDTIGIEPWLFAPPSGDYNQTTIEAAGALGYRTIFWSADTIDWRDQDHTLLLQRAVDKPTSGTLILTHPTKATAAVYGQILDGLAAKGLQVTTVGELIGK